MTVLLAIAILAGGSWLAIAVGKWINEVEKEGIVNTGYVGEEAPDEGKADL